MAGHSQNGIDGPEGRALWDRADQVLPGGGIYLSRSADMAGRGVLPGFIRSASGCRVIDADGVVETVEEIAAARGAPGHLRMDNGPEFVADALRDWCRLSGTATAYIEPGSPWENGHIESFNGRLRDECLNIEDFANLLEARVVIEDWRHEYNHYRPHRSLGGQTPPHTLNNTTKNNLMCAPFFGLCLWESGGVWLLVASLEFGG